MHKRSSVLLALLIFVGVSIFISGTMVLAAFPAQQAAACPGAPVPRLHVGDTGQVAQVFSSLRADLDSNIVLKVMYRANNDTFTVLAGPVCASGPYNWYQVNHAGMTGWVTEGTGSVYWIEPVTVVATPTAIGPTQPPTPTIPPTAVGPTLTPTLMPTASAACLGAPAPRLHVGDTGRVAQVFSSLRAGLDSNIVLKIMYRANNDTFTVLAGPFCASGPHNWYQVNHAGMIGWVTEGQGSTYWIEPAP